MSREAQSAKRGKMASIFLSYARNDADKAGRIVLALKQAGHSVWWDQAIGAGTRFSAEIDAALKNADWVVVLWSKASVNSAWVQDEAGAARDSDRLVPVLVEKVSPPLGFRQFQSVELTKGVRGSKAVEPLVEAIAQREGMDARRTKELSPRQGGWRSIRRPWIAAAIILGIITVGVIALIVLRIGRAEAEPASLAVLPFKNMSAGEPYFAEGVAEEIMNQLAREPQFKVAGRTSSALFKDAADLRDVGRRLHVAYVLEGSVRSANGQVRVDVALVDAGKGMRVWSQNYGGSLDDIFAIQESVGKQVATQLRRRLVHTAAVAGATTKRGDVYSLYVAARSLIRTREAAKLETAVDLLQQAVKLDPSYAPAWARLAQAKRMNWYFGHAGEPRSTWVRPDELRFAQRALALAPDLAEAHAVMGLLLAMSGNSTEEMKRRGRAEIERAVELDPTDAQNWYWLYVLREGDDLDFEGALAAARRAAEIDPFFIFNHYYGELAWDMGDRDAALKFLKHWGDNHPDPEKRTEALLWLANLRHDWSGVYRLLKQRAQHRPAYSHSGAETGMGMMLIRVGLPHLASKYVSPEHLAMRLGNAPTQSSLSELEPGEFWAEEAVPLYGRVLINHGRAADLVSLYDRAYPSRDSMVASLPKPDFVERAPVAAAALREVGRMAEAEHLLYTANQLCARAMRRGRTPITFQVDCSRSAAMLGDGDRAIRTLDRALKLGWRPEGGWSYVFADEPAYRSVHNDPRLKNLAQVVVSENQREQRELLKDGL